MFAYHLIREHEDCLECEFAFAVVEEVLETGSEQVNDHNIVITLDTEPMNIWNADYFIKAEMLIKQSSDFRGVFGLQNSLD